MPRDVRGRARPTCPHCFAPLFVDVPNSIPDLHLKVTAPNPPVAKSRLAGLDDPVVQQSPFPCSIPKLPFSTSLGARVRRAGRIGVSLLDRSRMATAAAFSSSPATMAHQHSIVVISSSPDFPSICDLLPKPIRKPPLRSGSNAAPVPEDAPAAFTSAASIWQASRTDQLEDTRTLELKPSRSAASAIPLPIPALDVQEPAGQGAKCEGSAGAKPKLAGTTRKKKAEKPNPRDAEVAVTETPATEAPPKKPGRKPRTAKATAPGQTTLPKGKVTKPSSKEAPSKKKTETVSRHFAQQISPPAPATDLVRDGPIQDEPVALEPAMRRRIDWTPPPESAALHRPADSSTAQELSSSVGPDPNGVFKTLQDIYGRAVDLVSNADESVLPAATTDILGKRKLLEMVAPVGNRKTPEPSPTKPKAVKKKPRTITELATAAYRQPEEEIQTANPQQDSLLDYLDTTSGPTAATGNGPAPKGKGSKRPRAKPKAVKKKDESRKQLLLSPTSAMRQVARQDFVFGTASQLATEDDPALLRALHEAMRVSNQPDGDLFASPNPVNSNLAIRKRPGTGLWTAGARYDGGDLPDWEVLDLTRSSPSSLAQPPSRPPAANQHTTVQDQASEAACIEIDMSDDTMDLSNSPPVGHVTQLLPSLPRPATQTLQLDDSSPSGHGRPQTPPQEFDFAPPPSNQEQHQLLLSQSSSPRQERPDLPQQPNFDLYTDARLAKEVASYGFKAVKKRTAMIALLGQCWTSQNKGSLGSRIGQASVSTASTLQAASPSRPRGRPRKNPAPSALDVAPPRGRKKSIPASNSESEAPPPEKRPRGRPRKDSVASIPDTAEPSATSRRGRKKSVDGGNEPPNIEKPARGRPKKDAVSPVAKRAKAKAASTAPATPKRRKAPAKSVVEIPDSESDDPFASTPPSSPENHDELFSSPPAMDLSVTEDTETSLMASPTTQQVTLFRYITQAVISAPRTTDPANPSWHDKMLMYDPIILEDLTGWLNAGQLDRVGHDGEVSPGDVKRWCESKSVCCLWRENLRGKERKRF